MAKSKHYAGKILFDIYGNQLHYPEGYPIELKAENLHEDGLWYNKFHNWGKGETFKKIFFQNEVKRLTEPKVSRYIGDKSGTKDVIAEINGYIEVDNYVFEDTLIYQTYSRGRSAAYFTLKSVKDDRIYQVFLSDFGTIVNNMYYGKVTGKFTFGKKGSNFGLQMIK